MVPVKDEFAAWTGGKPNNDWTGLDASAPKSHTNPNQLRPAGVSSQQKSYSARVAPLEQKFKKGDSVKTLETKIWDKLVDFGLDTVTYVHDPKDPTQMISVVKEHPRIMLKHAHESLKQLVPKWDPYDRQNDQAALKLFKDTCDDAVRNGVDCLLPPDKDAQEEEKTFASYWLRTMHKNSVSDGEHYKNITRRLEKCKASDYPGEDLSMLVTDYIADVEELEKGGMYDHRSTKIMLETFVAAGGEHEKVEVFRQQLRNDIIKITEALHEIRFLGTDALKQEHMQKAKLLPRIICSDVEDKYRVLRDNNSWPPASTVVDKSRVPPKYGNIASVTQGDLPATVVGSMSHQPAKLVLSCKTLAEAPGLAPRTMTSATIVVRRGIGSVTVLF